MKSDEFDNETRSSDGLQPKQADLSCVYALNELHLHVIRVVPKNGYDEKEVLKKLKRLQVNSTESVTSLRRLLREKSRIEGEIKATMHAYCSAILKDALPLKEKDLGSFSLPCSINNMCFDKALADLGASVSFMPYSTFSNLGLGFNYREMDDLDPDIEEGEIVDEPKVDVVNDEIVEKTDEYPNFAIVENMDAYRDKYIGDVIVRKPFCRVACIKAKRFDGFINIHDGFNTTYPSP
ncbi:hypothetical protein Tco_1156740 [Tanacetum coccineum]